MSEPVPAFVAEFLHDLLAEDRNKAKIAVLRAKLAKAERFDRVARWVAFAVFLTLAFAASLSAQGITNEREPLILWTTPPIIGMWSVDSERVDDSLPVIASADWPASADTAFAELRACTKIRGAGLDGWQLRTVAAAHFRVHLVRRDGTAEDGVFDGYTMARTKRIYVVQWMWRNRALLKHEMLHALLSEHGFVSTHGSPVADGMFRRCIK